MLYSLQFCFIYLILQKNDKAGNFLPHLHDGSSPKQGILYLFVHTVSWHIYLLQYMQHILYIARYKRQYSIMRGEKAASYISDFLKNIFFSNKIKYFTSQFSNWLLFDTVKNYSIFITTYPVLLYCT